VFEDAEDMRASFAEEKIEIFIAVTATKHNEFVEKCKMEGQLVLPLLPGMAAIFNDGCIIKIRRSYRFVK
jgi:hypothetical protein